MSYTRTSVAQGAPGANAIVSGTTLDTLDNTQIVLPNATIWGNTIKNYTGNETRRNDLSIGISYGDNIGKARAVIQEVLDADPRVLKSPEPLIAVENLGESSVDLLVGPWCHPDHYWDLRFDLFQKIKEALDANQVTIPFPQRDLHIQQLPPQNTSAA